MLSDHPTVTNTAAMPTLGQQAGGQTRERQPHPRQSERVLGMLEALNVVLDEDVDSGHHKRWHQQLPAVLGCTGTGAGEADHKRRPGLVAQASVEFQQLASVNSVADQPTARCGVLKGGQALPASRQLLDAQPRRAAIARRCPRCRLHMTRRTGHGARCVCAVGVAARVHGVGGGKGPHANTVAAGVLGLIQGAIGLAKNEAEGERLPRRRCRHAKGHGHGQPLDRARRHGQAQLLGQLGPHCDVGVAYENHELLAAQSSAAPRGFVRPPRAARRHPWRGRASR